MPKSENQLDGLSDLQLFDLTKKDQPKAFDELYRRHWPVLVDEAYRRLQSKQRSEDIVQDIFVAIYNRRHTLELNSSFLAYTRKALKFSILNEFRSAIVQEKYQKYFFLSEDCKIDFIHQLDAKSLNYKIQHTIGKLPHKCKQAFILSRVYLAPYKEISKELNISVSTVEKHMVKALGIMRSNLKEYNYY